MSPEQLLTWIGIVAAVGGAAMTYGLLRGRVDEQERRIEKLESRADGHDEALKTMIRIEARLDGMMDLIKSLQPQQRRRATSE